MSKTIQVQLPEEGSDKYVIIRDPMFMRVRDQRELRQKEDEAPEDLSVRLLKFLVTGGNIAAEDGRVLAYPLTDDDIDEFTNYVIAEVMKTFQQRSEAMNPSKN